jgi:serine/threonine protein kinase
MHKLLVVIAGPDNGRVFRLTGSYPLLIGRSHETETRLRDLRVSRVHCEVAMAGSDAVLTDLDSVGGTYINGQRVVEQALEVGDVIRVGDTQLRFQNGEVADQPTLPPTDTMPRVRPAALPAERLHQLAGTTLSHFHVGEVIARGQTGLVFQARDFKVNRTVAFKVLWPQFSKNDDEMQRFIRSMKTMLPIRHPNLVTLYGAGKTGPYCWIAMELIRGDSLATVLENLGVAGMLDWRYALRVGMQIGRALHFAHLRHIIHRNVRPQNILIQGGKVAKLGDLMLAKALEGGLAQQITKPGELLGDVRYLAPEQTSGATDVDARADLYSLGATMYALLTGQAPFDGTSLVDTVIKIRQTEPTRPTMFQQAIPELFEGIVLKALAKRPQDRFASAAKLLSALERVARSQAGFS